jgi:hypothetical protein
MLFESYGIGPLVHMPQVRTAFITPAREAALIWHGAPVRCSRVGSNPHMIKLEPSIVRSASTADGTANPAQDEVDSG